MSGITGNTTYLVRLGKDGQWQWAAAPSPKFISDYYVAFPPESTPGFLVDLGPDYLTLDPSQNWPWKVISVQDLWHDDIYGAETLLKQGWGALSYQWGEFIPYSETAPRYKFRPFYESREAFNLPTAYVPPNASPDLARAWNWGIPKIARLGITNFKKALRTVGLRYIWWDAACLPQRDFSKGYKPDLTRTPPYPGAPWLPGDLQKTADAELLKQKFVYEKASVGITWLNQIKWDDASSLKTILERTPRIIDLDVVKTILYTWSDNRQMIIAQDTPAVVILSNVLTGLKDPAAQQDKDLDGTEFGPNLGKPKEWRDAIENFVKLMKAVRAEEGWFRSLWSFQEGRLLKAQAFVDYNGTVLGVGKSYDPKGNPVSFPKTWIEVDGISRLANSPSIRELTAFATLLAGQISLAYVAFNGFGTAAMAIPPLVELWDITKPDSQTTDKPPRSCLEPIMRDLVGTGILYNPDESPLELILAARRTRFPSLFFKDEYYAMTGVLGMVKISETQDYTMNDGPWGYSGPRDPEESMQWLRSGLPRVFFEALVKRYQWLVLLLAKRSVDDVKHWGAISMGHFETINPYCEKFSVEKELTIDRKDWKYVLPQLTYLPDTDVLKITPAAGSVGDTALSNGSILKSLKAVNIICHKVTKDWAAKQVILYALVDDALAYEDDPIDAVGMVPEVENFRQIKPSNVVQTKTLTSKDVGGIQAFLLIPFESLGFDLVSRNNRTGATRDPKMLNQRCLLMRDVVLSSTKRSISAYFGGIVDVNNLVTETIKVDEIRLGWQAAVSPNTAGPNPTQNGAQASPPTSGAANTSNTGASAGSRPSQSSANTVKPTKATGPPPTQGSGRPSPGNRPRASQT